MDVTKKADRKPKAKTRPNGCKLKLTALAVFSALAALFLLIQSQTLNRTPEFTSRHDPSCLSRHAKYSYGHRTMTTMSTTTTTTTSNILQPSPYLLSKLQRYEALHSRCGPLSRSFNRTGCNYLVYTPSSGLGNRIIALASTFLYALLTDRVLLVHFDRGMEDLFCEPFPASTWLLPQNSSLVTTHRISQFGRFREAYSYGNLLKNKNKMMNSSFDHSLVQIFLEHSYNNHDKLFFRDEHQEFLRGVPWLVLLSNLYFAPSLFHMQSFRPELERLFPGEKIESVFYHLGNYLFNPSNRAWDLITQFYQPHLEKAGERVGLQVRVVEPERNPHSLVMKRVLDCIQNHKEGLLSSSSSKAIFIASLSTKFYEEMKSMYDSKSGIEVFQASREGKQHFGDTSHNMKAWVDMYLLSMSDVLVTSGMSTFGYVAAGLGGMRPWILMFPPPIRRVKDTVVRHDPEGSCERAVNMEPCFHAPPRFSFPGVAGGPIRLCEDVPWGGLKLVAPRFDNGTD